VNMLSNFCYIFFYLGVQIPVSDLCGVVQTDSMLSIPIWFGSSKVPAILVAIPFVLLLVIGMILQERLLIFFRAKTFIFLLFSHFVSSKCLPQ